MLSVIVINFRMEDLTVRFVSEELSKIKIPYKTVIVNNAANDESNAALCSSLSAELVCDDSECDLSRDCFVLSSGENLGFAKGNNLGAEFSRRFDPEFILFANNDIVFQDEDVVERLMEKLAAVQDAGVIGPRVVGIDGALQSPHPFRSFWDKEVWMYWSSLFWSKEKKIKEFSLDYSEKASEGFHYYVMGSFLLVRAEDFYACGMFDPHTFLYAEEPILSERMAAVGKGVYYLPSVTVIHAHGATTATLPNGKRRDWQFESNMYYYRTYCHTGPFLLMLGRLTHALMKCRKR